MIYSITHPGRSLCVAALLLSLFMAPQPLLARQGLKPKEMVVEPGRGYLLVRVGPANGRNAITTPILFSRIDPESGDVISGAIANASKKTEYDAAQTTGGRQPQADGVTPSYILPVNPGRWVIVGIPDFLTPTAFSMGAYGFEVRAGEIVDLGTILAGREDGKSPIAEIASSKLAPDLVNFGAMMNIVMTWNALLLPPSGPSPIPSEFAALPVRRATVESDIRFTNTMGWMVNRMIGLPAMAHEQAKAGSQPSARP